MKILKQFALVYFSLLLLFTILIVAVHFIPRAAIRDNVIKSTQTIQEEGLYHKILNFKLFQLDNYTDAIMLNEAISGDSKKPIESALKNNWNKSKKYFELVNDTQDFANGNFSNLQTHMYGRYWHGYLVTLKPLLVFFDYSNIRIINFILLFSLFIWCLYEVYQKLGIKIMIFFILSFLSINFFIIPLSLQFSSVFYITLISIILILRRSENSVGNNWIFLLFFAIGGLTAFFDLLTAPLIALSLPVVIYFLKYKNQNTFQNLIYISISWGIGYGLLWASKWGIGILLTGDDFMSTVLYQIGQRTNLNVYKEMEMTLPNIIYFLFYYLRKYNLIFMFWLSISIALTALVSYFYFLKSKIVFYKNITFLLIVLMFPVWAIILKYHTIQHGWYTWRSIIGMVFSFLIFIDNTVDWSKFKRLMRK